MRGGPPGPSSATDLDGQYVFGAGVDGRGDVEAVGEKVTLRVSQIGAVQPHIRLVKDPLHDQPRPRRLGQRAHLEAPPVQQRAVRGGKRRLRLPVAGDHDRLPGAIVEIGAGEAAAQVLVGL